MSSWPMPPPPPDFVESTWRHVAAHARWHGICPPCGRRVIHLTDGYCDNCRSPEYRSMKEI